MLMTSVIQSRAMTCPAPGLCSEFSPVEHHGISPEHEGQFISETLELGEESCELTYRHAHRGPLSVSRLEQPLWNEQKEPK
jgi:hypothetical protein